VEVWEDGGWVKAAFGFSAESKGNRRGADSGDEDIAGPNKPTRRIPVDLETPTPRLVHRYVDRFEKLDRYYKADEAIIKLFKLLPYNIDLADVLLKLSVINDLYSTNIFATFKMAKHIQDLNIDNDLTICSEELVNRIANFKNRGKTRHFFSFATKYCSWHKPDDYPISDTFVEKLIIGYRNRERFAQFKNADLRNYPQFKLILTAFRQHFGLLEFGFKKLDKFLWLYGKEKFGKAGLATDDGN
jgi:hypothetical protein